MPAHPASAVRRLEDLRSAVARCRLCGDAVVPPGLLWAQPGQRAAIWGLAPGHREAEGRMPFIGPAGVRLRRWLEPIGLGELDDFHATFAVVAVLKCYPGRAASGRGDRVPRPSELARCRPWSEAALRLLDPPLVVPVGRLAIAEWLPQARLDRVVGQRFEVDGRAVVPLPHPSGASAWANGVANQELIARAVRHIGDALETVRH